MFAAYRRASTVAALAALGIETIELDVTIAESIAAAKALVAGMTGGRLDVLVNNAGQGSPRPCTDLEVDSTVKAIFDVNVFGVMRVVQAFAPLLIEAEGTVVNIGSVAPIIPLVFGAAYNASKAALHAYADCLRMELKPFNVHVITIITGGVRSNIVRSEYQELPADSLYQPIKEFWLKRVGLSQQTPMDTEAYAKSVVKQIVDRGGRSRKWFWQGHFAWKAWFLHTFLWKGFTDYFVSKRFGLVDLARMVQEQKKAKVKEA